MGNSVFNGCATAIVTPFSQVDYSVNFEELGRIVEFQIENGIDAIVVCGTTGEASTMPDAEHLSVIKYVVDAVSKRVPVIAGAGSNDTRHAVQLSQEAQNAGADALLHVTPYYNKTSQAGLVAHFTAVADAVSIPIVLYNVPGRTGMTIAPTTYAQLAKHPNITMTKEASANFTDISTAMNLCGETLDFVSGNDDNIVPLMALGGKGVISVLSNVKPKETTELCRLVQNGKYEQAAKLQLAMMPLINALFSDVNPIPVKAAMNMIGFNAGPCRLPLAEMDEAKREALRELL
jgi:dihydrodipicolinate synthase